MALQIHRHDVAAARGGTAEEDRNLVHGLAPSLDEEREWKMRVEHEEYDSSDANKPKGWKKKKSHEETKDGKGDCP